MKDFSLLVEKPTVALGKGNDIGKLVSEKVIPREVGNPRYDFKNWRDLDARTTGN